MNTVKQLGMPVDAVEKFSESFWKECGSSRNEKTTESLCNEAVSYAAHGQQMLRLARVFFEIAPEAHDEIINRPRIGVFVQSPDIPEDRAARYGATLVLDQVTQQLRFHQRQLDGAVLCTEFQRSKVDGLSIEAENFIVVPRA